MISILDSGGVMNDPSASSANWDAYVAAIATLSALGGGALTIPDGAFYVDVPEDGVGATIAGVSIAILGAEKHLTRIVTQSDVTSDLFMHSVAADGGMTLRDLTLIGPATTSGAQTRAVQSFGPLTLSDVVTQNWLAPVYAMSGAYDLILEDCAFGGSGVGPATFQVGIQDIRRARIRDCMFSGYGVSGSDQAHGIYCYKSVDLEVGGCTFDTQYGTGYSVQMFGGSGVSPSVSVHDCLFAASTYQGVLTNPTVRTRISDSRFLCLGSGVIAQYDTDIDDCEFSVSAPIASPITMAGSYPSLVRVSDTRFDIPMTGVYGVNVSVSGARAILSNCYGSCNDSFAASAVSGATYQLIACEFVDQVGHFTLRSKQTTPSVSAVAANVTGAGVAGNDIRGYVQFSTTATIPAGTALCTVIPNNLYSAAPYVQVTNQTADKAAVAFGVSGVGYGGWTLRNLAPLPIATLIKVSFFVVD